MKPNQTYDYKFRIYVLGSNSTGKPELVRSFVKGGSTSWHFKGLGDVEFKQHTFVLNGKRIEVNIWDTAELEDHSRTGVISSFYKDVRGIILAYDTGRLDSFLFLDEIIKDTVRHSAGTSSRLVLGVNRHSDNIKQVDSIMVQRFANEYGYGWSEVNLEDANSIEKLFTDLVYKQTFGEKQQSQYKVFPYTSALMQPLYLLTSKGKLTVKENEAYYLSTKEQLETLLMKIRCDSDLNDELLKLKAEHFLHFCCKHNKIEGARLCLRLGAGVNAVDNKKQTPLYVACKRRHLDLIRLLSQRGGYLGRFSKEELNDELKLEIKDSLKLRIDFFDSNIIMIEQNRISEVDVAGDFLSTNEIHRLVQALLTNTSVVRVYLGGQFKRLETGYTQLLQMRLSLLPGIRALIEAGNWSLLEHSILVRELSKANVQILHIFALMDKRDKVTELLSAGVEISLKDNAGLTAIDWAVLGGNTELAEMLKAEKDKQEFMHLLSEQAQNRAERLNITEQKVELEKRLEALTLGDSFGFCLQRLYMAWASTREIAQTNQWMQALLKSLNRPQVLINLEHKSLSQKWLGKGDKLSKDDGVFKEINRVVKQIDEALKKLSITESAREIVSTLTEVREAYLAFIVEIRAASPEKRVTLAKVPVTLYGAGMPPRLLKEEGCQKLRPVGGRQVTQLEQGTKQLQLWVGDVSSGTHTVKVLGGIHFKQDPHAPGVEFMVDSLSQILAGRGAAPTELIKVLDEHNRGVAYLASKTVVGRELDHVIKKHPEFIEQVAPDNFSAMMVIGLLTDPQDGKPDNYMVELEVNADKTLKSLEIIGIDNDIAFADAVVLSHDGERKGEHFVNVKNVLYFFPQMKKPISNGFREKFLSRIPALVMIEWITSLHEKNKEYEALLTQGIFSKEEFSGDGLLTSTGKQRRGLQLPIKLVPGTVRKVYQKLIQLHDLMNQDSVISHEALFKRIEPILYRYYQRVHKQVDQQLPQGHVGEKLLAAIGILYAESAETVEAATNLESIIHTQVGHRLGSELVLKTSEKFGFEEKRVQPMAAAMEELVCCIDWHEMDKRSRDTLYETIDKTQLVNFEYKSPVAFICMMFIKHVCDLSLMEYFLEQPDVLLETTCPLEVENYKGRSLLHTAVSCGEHEAVGCLLKKGSKVNATNPAGDTALHLAMRRGDVRVMAVLLCFKVDVTLSNKSGQTALEMASGRGWTVSKLCFEAIRKKVRSRELWDYLASRIKKDIREDNGDTLLHMACRYHQLSTVQFLLERGLVDIEAVQGELPISLLAKWPKLEVSAWPAKAIHLAAEFGDDEMVELLVNAGANSAALDSRGNTVLHRAVQAGRLKLVRQLLSQSKASLNAQNKRGETAIHLAVEKDNVMLLKLLLAFGADLLVENGQGMTPLVYAQKADKRRCASYLSVYESNSSSKLDIDKLSEWDEWSCTECWGSLYEEEVFEHRSLDSSESILPRCPAGDSFAQAELKPAGVMRAPLPEKEPVALVRAHQEPWKEGHSKSQESPARHKVGL